MRPFQAPFLRRLLVITVTLVLSHTAIDASAQRPGPGARQRHYPPGLAEVRLAMDNAETLELSEEKIAALAKLAEDVKAEEARLRTLTVDAQTGLHTLLDTNRLDPKALAKASAAAAEAGGKTRELRLNTSATVRKMLTDEQLTKFMELRSNAFGKKRAKRGKAGKRGARPRVEAEVKAEAKAEAKAGGDGADNDAKGDEKAAEGEASGDAAKAPDAAN